MPRKPDREVLIELMQVGNAVRVSAIDPATGVEVTIVGSPYEGEDTLKRNAIRKLNYVLEKAKSANGKKNGGPGVVV